jgi:hypothetical protein
MNLIAGSALPHTHAGSGASQMAWNVTDWRVCDDFS